MANQANKKEALLYLRDFLLQNTDEEHRVGVPDIIDMLKEHNIESDRRTIYSDLKLLQDQYGMDLNRHANKYYVKSRDFDLQELQILADMIRSSNFVTAKKTEDLIKKLGKQTSIYNAGKLRREIHVRNRIKSTNESVFINVDKLSEAMSLDVQVSFQYYRYNIRKEKELRQNGKKHIISPYALIWVDLNYYLLGYDDKAKELRHYRVDRITNLKLTKNPRVGKEAFEQADLSTYTNKVFHMFSGDEVRVTLQCKSRLADAVIDRFGEDVILVPGNRNTFTFETVVAVSPQFFAWVAGFGTDMEILQPSYVRKMMYDQMTSIAAMYSEFAPARRRKKQQQEVEQS